MSNFRIIELSEIKVLLMSNQVYIFIFLNLLTKKNESMKQVFIED